VSAGETPTNVLNGGGARWVIDNDNGTDNALPAGGECDGSPGFGVGDASLPDAEQGDAFDNGVTIWVNDSIFVAPEPLSFEPQSITAGPVLMSGLNASVQYFALPDTPLLRTLASFQNPSEEPITATITLATNIGSDSNSEVAATSSGDTAFTTGDRWVITDDEGEGAPTAGKVGVLASEDGDPALTHVLYGPGAPRVTSSTVSEVVYDCAGTEGILATFSLTVPAGATRRLMFFNGLHETSGAAIAAVADFNEVPEPDSGLLADLSETQLGEIENWEFSEAVELASFLATGSGSVTIRGGRHSFAVSARKDRRRSLRGSVSYTGFQTGIQFRSIRITGAQGLGTRGVRLLGVGRIGRSGPLNFTLDLVDNPGSNADTFRLSVSNGLVVPTTVIERGNIRVRTHAAEAEPTPDGAGR
jgi:hypothetical protein